MVVGNNESMTTKNAGKLLAISIAMPMWQYNAGCIAQWSTSSQVSGLHWRYGASLGGPLCDAYNPTLGLFSRTCLHRMSDDNQTRPKHTTQRPNKHHHHGSGAATPQAAWI
jgi:hypothetical protein